MERPHSADRATRIFCLTVRVTTNVKILTFCGSLRSSSVNAATMRAALANAPEGVEFIELDVRDIPFYDGDVEEAGVPASVVNLHDQLNRADGLMIFTPEYNGSYPAVTKNVIDWLSRPPKSWENRGITMVVTTPGSRGGESLRGHFDASMDYFQVRNHPSLGIGKYGDKLDDNGEIVDPDTIAALREFIEDFAQTCIAEDEKD